MEGERTHDTRAGAGSGHQLLEQLLYEVKRTIVGQDVLLERMVVALLARGHLLVDRGHSGAFRWIRATTSAAKMRGLIEMEL